MPAIPTSYIVPFDPLGNPLGTILTAAQHYNQGFKRIKRGSAVAPYPNPATIYCQSESPDREEDFDLSLEVAIGYAGSIGTSLWSEIREDRTKVCPGYGVMMLSWLTLV